MSTKPIIFTFNRRKLDRLRKDCGKISPTELVNNALTLFEHVLLAAKHGEKIGSIDKKTGKVTLVTMPALQHAATSA